MDSILKKGLFLVTVSGTITAFPIMAQAADIDDTQDMPTAGIEQVLGECYTSEKTISVKDYLVPTQKGEYLDMAFANVQSFLYIRSEPTTESEWVGKLYPDYAAKIIGPVGEWTKVQSGNVTGYVYSEYITVGNEAQKKAEELVQKKDTENAKEAFTYAESKEEEAARLQKEAEQKAEEEKKAAEEAAKQQEEQQTQAAQTGQAIVDYACQFIGNPYVWGGTSLTNGADCSGFVQSVYKNFGYSLPRTCTPQSNAGTAVSLAALAPGDLVFYDHGTGSCEHVGIYIGNGQIVHASSSRTGIKISNVNYSTPFKACRIVN